MGKIMLIMAWHGQARKDTINSTMTHSVVWNTEAEMIVTQLGTAIVKRPRGPSQDVETPLLNEFKISSQMSINRELFPNLFQTQFLRTRMEADRRLSRARITSRHLRGVRR